MKSNDEKWITLKEAAKISGYSPDYIGELIRKGKIPGKQIVCNVAWVTLKDAILEYKERQKRGEGKKKGKKERFFEFLGDTKRKFLLQFEILKLLLKTFRNFFILFLIFVLFLAGFLSYFLFSIEKKNIQNEKARPIFEKTEGPIF